MSITHRQRFRIPGGTRKLTLVTLPLPEYTREAWENRAWGTVVLRLTCGSSGEVTGIEVIIGLPDGLTEQALEAAKKIEFIPELRDNCAISKQIEVGYSFSLDSWKATVVHF
jgi:TonB family protein